MPKRLFEMVTGDSSGYSQSKQSRSSVGNATSVGKSKVYRKSKSGGKGLAKYIKSVIQNSAEKKQALTGVSATLTSTQSSVTLVSGMSQGTTGSNRVGDEITYAYFEVNLYAYNLVTAASTPPWGDSGFWALVLDRQPNGALAAFGDIFDDSIGAISGTDFRTTLKNSERFYVLKREEWALGNCGSFVAGTYSASSGASPYHCNVYIDMSKKGKDAKEGFNAGTTGAITAIDTNAVLFVWASAMSTTNNTTTMTGQVRCRFTDI